MKKTVFRGVVNGEPFDNVQAYNARVTELMENGKFESASSNTEVVDIVDGGDLTGCLQTLDSIFPEDEDAALFPYFMDDDPHYLDLLVTEDSTTNAEAREEAARIREKCYSFIVDNLYDTEVDKDTVNEYLDEVRTILVTLRRDAANNNTAMEKVASDRAQVEATFAAAKERYNSDMQTLDRKTVTLNAAAPIIRDFIEFYERVEAEAMQALIERRDEHTCTNCGKPECECKCDRARKTDVDADAVLTTFKEALPQLETEFKQIFGDIFGVDLNDLKKIINQKK